MNNFLASWGTSIADAIVPAFFVYSLLPIILLLGSITLTAYIKGVRVKSKLYYLAPVVLLVIAVWLIAKSPFFQ